MACWLSALTRLSQRPDVGGGTMDLRIWGKGVLFVGLTILCCVVGCAHYNGTSLWVERSWDHEGPEIILLHQWSGDGWHDFAAPTSVLTNAPPWDGTGSPPLPVSRAVNAARAWLKTTDPDYREFEVTDERLKAKRLADRQNKALTVRLSIFTV